MQTVEERRQSSIDFLDKLHELLKEYKVDIMPEMSSGYQQYVIGMEFDFPVHGIMIHNDYIDADNVKEESIRLSKIKDDE